MNVKLLKTERIHKTLPFLNFIKFMYYIVKHGSFERY